MSNNERESVLVNFRPAKGLRERVYRTGTTDGLVSVVQEQELTESERIFLHDITLNVDLRSRREINLEKEASWTSRAPGGRFQVVEGVENVTNDDASRIVVHCDLISNVFRYIDKNWLSDMNPKELEDHSVAMRCRMNAIKDHGGLAGLFQVILQANHEELCAILKLITVNLEKNGKVMINCTQGKDRTGLLAMLLQSAAGVSEKDIVADFAESQGFEQSKRGCAAMQAAAERFKFDTSILSGAPPEVMEATLAFLKKEYGSVSPGFLDEIGFDGSWRSRLVAALDKNTDTDLPN